MDEVLKRFPVVGQKIFKQLDDKDIAKSKKVGKIWYGFPLGLPQVYSLLFEYRSNFGYFDYFVKLK